MTRSLHIAIEDLELEHVWVVYPGDHRFPLGERVTALPVRELAAWSEVRSQKAECRS